MSIRKLIQAAACAALFTSGTAFAATELIVNGSFEANTQANGTWDIYPSLTGWTGGDYGIELRNNVAGTAYEGSNFVELDTTHNSLMYQKIDTVAGQAYTLSFAYSPRPGVTKDSNGIKVLWNGTEVAVEKANGVHNTVNDWNVYTFTVIGGDKNKSKLEFKAVGDSDSFGGSLDAVSLTSAVPEPGTYAMLMLGLGLVGLVGRRNKQQEQFKA